MQKNTRILFILLFLLLIIMIFYISRKLIKNNASASSYNKISNTTETLTDIQESKKDITFNLTAIGDIMCHNTQYFDAYNSSTDSYDFSYVFSDISHYIQDSDITVANLETTFAGKDRGYSNYPRFNTPDELAYDIGKLGVDVVSTSGTVVKPGKYVQNGDDDWYAVYRIKDKDGNVTAEGIEVIPDGEWAKDEAKCWATKGHAGEVKERSSGSEYYVCE